MPWRVCAGAAKSWLSINKRSDCDPKDAFLEGPNQKMSSNDKRTALFQAWLSPPKVEFISGDAEKDYKKRVHRFIDAIELKKTPDRVPIFPFVQFFPVYHADMTPRQAMYDYDAHCRAWKAYVLDFKPDAHTGSFVAGPGKAYDILDYKLYAWPGHGIADHLPFQCLEAEYVKPQEYDALIQNPNYFFKSTYLPRVFGALDAWKKLPSLVGFREWQPTAFDLASYGTPEVQAAYSAFLEAAREALKWSMCIDRCDKEIAGQGFPNMFGSVTTAPFDAIGDTLRGSEGIILDMYRQPEKLLEALGTLTPSLVRLGVRRATENGNPIVFIPLHKGDDQFMSHDQFKTFYWPSFKRLLLGLIDEGCVPFVFAEGSYNTRLEFFGEVPKGKIIYVFDQTDLAKAKQVLGDVACIGGNMPSSLLCFGTTQEVCDHTKALIDTAAEGGGYLFSTGTILDKARPDNVHAMIECAKTHGVY